jgi:hypothetical protein
VAAEKSASLEAVVRNMPNTTNEAREEKLQPSAKKERLAKFKKNPQAPKRFKR